MDKDLREAFDDVHAEVLALNGLVVGLCAALQAREYPMDIVEDAFELAEMSAITGSEDAAMKSRAVKMLGVLESLRKAVFS